MKDTAISDYRTLRAELDDLLEILQDESTDVEVALKAHERGLIIIKSLLKHLELAENQITKLHAENK